MRGNNRLIAALGVLAALTAASQATITISILPSEGTALGGQATVSNTALSDGTLYNNNMAGPNTHSVMGGFQFSSDTNEIIKISSNVQTNDFALGTLTFDASIFDGTNFIPVLSRGGQEHAGVDTALNTSRTTRSLHLAANTTYSLFYTATFKSDDITNGDSYATISQAVFLLEEAQPVPEPASFAAIGVGVIGLIARRRKGAK